MNHYPKQLRYLFLCCFLSIYIQDELSYYSWHGAAFLVGIGAVKGGQYLTSYVGLSEKAADIDVITSMERAIGIHIIASTGFCPVTHGAHSLSLGPIPRSSHSGYDRSSGHSPNGSTKLTGSFRQTIRSCASGL